MLIVRPIAEEDSADLLVLAHLLDSVNLPAEPEFLRARIAASQCSFEHQLEDWRQGVYLFVLEDTDAGRCVGTSMIRAKHGTPDAPYYYFEVSTEERRSTELGKHFVHTRLQLMSSSG